MTYYENENYLQVQIKCCQTYKREKTIMAKTNHENMYMTK